MQAHSRPCRGLPASCPATKSRRWRHTSALSNKLRWHFPDSRQKQRQRELPRLSGGVTKWSEGVSNTVPHGHSFARRRSSRALRNSGNTPTTYPIGRRRIDAPGPARTRLCCGTMRIRPGVRGKVEDRHSQGRPDRPAASPCSGTRGSHRKNGAAPPMFRSRRTNAVVEGP